MFQPHRELEGALVKLFCTLMDASEVRLSAIFNYRKGEGLVRDCFRLGLVPLTLLFHR